MAFLTQLYHTPGGAQRGPFLVVAPLSLITQWHSEAGTWAPDLNVLVYHGNTCVRLRLFIWVGLARDDRVVVGGSIHRHH